MIPFLPYSGNSRDQIPVSISLPTNLWTMFFCFLWLRSYFVTCENACATLCGLSLFSLQSLCIRLQNATQRRIMAISNKKEMQTWN